MEKKTRILNQFWQKKYVKKKIDPDPPYHFVQTVAITQKCFGGQKSIQFWNIRQLLNKKLKLNL